MTPSRWSELAQRIRAVDPAAERQIADLFRAGIVAMASSRLKDREAAADIAQDALWVVLRALRAGSVRDPGRLPGFVAGTAKNLTNNYARSQNRAPAIVPLPEDLDVLAPGSPEEGEERESLVNAVVRRLKVKDREILLLTIGDNLKPRQIARRVGMKSENVRTRKSRAIKAVSREIARLLRNRE